jgi:serine/threonine protein kinase
MPRPWSTAVAASLIALVVESQVQAGSASLVCVVTNASDAWDISDREGCDLMGDAQDIYGSEYATGNRLCADHIAWHGEPTASLNSSQLTGTLRYCLSLSARIGSITFNISQDEYNDQPAANRTHFTIYVEQQPGFCDHYNGDHTRRMEDRSLQARDSILIDGDTQPVGMLNPGRDPALPKIVIRPKESLCWQQSTKDACEATLYCKRCANVTDRNCFWNADLSTCQHRTPYAFREFLTSATDSTGISEVTGGESGCPNSDRYYDGFTPRYGLIVYRGATTIRGLGIVGFGRTEKSSFEGGIKINVNRGLHNSDGVDHYDGGADGTVHVEGCYLAGNANGLVKQSEAELDNRSSHLDIVVKSSALRKTTIEGNIDAGMFLFHSLTDIRYYAVNTTVEDADIGRTSEVDFFDLTGMNYPQQYGIRTYEGATLNVFGATMGDHRRSSIFIGELSAATHGQNNESGTLTVANSRFAGAQVGIYVRDVPNATVRITSSTFEPGARDGGVGVLIESQYERSELYITDSNFTDMPGRGIYSDSTATVLRCSFERGIGEAIVVGRTADGTTITDSNFTDHEATTGTVVSLSPDFSMQRCDFNRNYDGLRVHGNNLQIDQTSIRSTAGTALTIEPEIANSMLEHAELLGVVLVDGGVGMKVRHALDVTIEDSAVSNFTRSDAAGVELNRVANAAFTNVTIQSNAGGGLSLVSCENSSISALLVSGNAGDGVHVHSDSPGAVLSSVRARSNSGRGLDIAGPNAAVVSATVRDNGGDGVHVSVSAEGFNMSGTSAAPVTIANNTGSGVHVAAPSVAITGTVRVGVVDIGPDRLAASGNGADGILTTDTAAGAIIGGGAVVAGNEGHGISIAGAGSSVFDCLVGVAENGGTAMPNGGVGIRLLESGNATQIGRAGTTTGIGGAQGGPAIDVSATDVVISSVTVGSSVDTAVALPNCHAGIWLRPSASRGIVADSSVAGTVANCSCCTAEANRGYGVLVDAADAHIVRCRVGVGGDQDQVNIGNAAGGILLSATNGTIELNLVGNNGGHGITVSAGAQEGARIQHNLIGECRGRNCSNLGYGIFIDASSDLARIVNNTIGFNGRLGLRVGQNSSAEASANILNNISLSTNSWLFANACDQCVCTMYCYTETGGNASACRSEQHAYNYSHVDCSNLDFGPDFPIDFPNNVSQFTMRNSEARRVNLAPFNATLAAVDLQGNPYLDASAALRSVPLPMLRYLDLDGTIVHADLVDAMRSLDQKDGLQFLSIADPSTRSDLVLNLTGFANLGALSWGNVETCPPGFYDTASFGGDSAGAALCLRCPVNSYQPKAGQVGRAVCAACADGTYDYDNDPTTECETSTFSLNTAVWPTSTVMNVATGFGPSLPDCEPPCIHDKYEKNSTYTLRVNRVEGMFNSHGLDAVAFATFIHDGAPAGDGCTFDAPLGPLLTRDQAEVNIDSRDGTTLFRPMTTGRGFSVVMKASDLSSGATVTVRRWCFDVLERDIDSPDSNGGRTCKRGDPVEDGFQLNRIYECKCEEDKAGKDLFQGRYCDEANVDSVVGPKQDADSSTLVTAGALGGTLFLCFVVIARLRYRVYLERKEESTPVDFAARLTVLEDQGLIRSTLLAGETPDGDDEEGAGFLEPNELKRKAIDLIDTLGAGAFGEVMKGVYCPPDGTPEFAVAVKVLKGEPSNDEREELLKEAVITAQFTHTNVVGLVGVVTSGSPYMLVLQFCEGGALQSVLKTKKFDIPGKDLLGYCLGISKGMHYLSSKHFVHRDLATRNVLLDSRRGPKVADFGLSRDMESADYYTAAESAKMPIRWSAPECISQQKFSEKSDVWAFGVAMIEIYTRGETPYRGWINSYVVEQVLEGFTLPIPMECPDKVYADCIAPCFELEKEHRPTFSFLVERLDLYMRNFAQLTVATVEERTSRLSSEVLRVLPPGSDQFPAITEEQVTKADAEDQYEDFGASDEAPTSLFVGFGLGGSTMVKDLSKKKMAAFSSNSKATELATMMMLEEQRALAEARQQSHLHKAARAADDIENTLTSMDGASGYTGQHRIDPKHRLTRAVSSRQASTDDQRSEGWEDGETFGSAATFSNGDVTQAMWASSGPKVSARNAPLPVEPQDQRAELLAWHEEHSMSNAAVEETRRGSDGLLIQSATLQRRLSQKSKGKGKNELYIPESALTAHMAPGGNVGMAPVPGFELGDLGRRVKLSSSTLTGTGLLRFVGLHKQKGVPRVGIEMDDAVGLNDGALNGGADRYFACAPNRGVFANPAKVRFESRQSIELLGMGEASDEEELTI